MFMDIAFTVAQRGTCPRARVGAVIVDPSYNIVSIGYNGSPVGADHCDEVGCLMENGHCVRTVHAELNAIVRGHVGKRYENGNLTMYVTHSPCQRCASQIIALGGKTIQRVVYQHPYRIYDQEVWEKGGVTFERLIHDRWERSIPWQTGENSDKAYEFMQHQRRLYSFYGSPGEQGGPKGVPIREDDRPDPDKKAEGDSNLRE